MLTDHVSSLKEKRRTLIKSLKNLRRQQQAVTNMARRKDQAANYAAAGGGPYAVPFSVLSEHYSMSPYLPPPANVFYPSAPYEHGAGQYDNTVLYQPHNMYQ